MSNSAVGYYDIVAQCVQSLKNLEVCIDEAEKQSDVIVFHAGTTIKDDQLVTNGGRVLFVTATGETLDQALQKTYAAIELIHFEGMHYRTDIGRRSH